MYKASSVINGEMIYSQEEKNIFSPIDNLCIGTIPVLNSEQIKNAFDGAFTAFSHWKKESPITRQQFMLAFAEKLRQHSLLLAELLHKETGKSLIDAKNEIDRSVTYIVETIHAFDNLMKNPEEYDHENELLVPKNINATFLREPHGVVLTISPFNYPVNLMLTKIVPAILMGNCVVHKSATQGSLCGWYLAKLFNELAFENSVITPGVFNYITGTGKIIGESIKQQSNKVSAMSFTGSTDIGLQLSEDFPHIPKQLEMGGLNVAIVLKDADISGSVQEILKGAFSFSGQRCTAVKKILIEKPIYKEVIKEIESALPKFQEDIAPLISKFAVEETKSFYLDALDKKAVLISQPIEWKDNSLIVSPIVFKDIKPNMKLFNKELFGPILGLMEFEKLEDAINIINDSDYGLQASIFSENIELSSEIALELDVGRVNINLCPTRSPDILPFSGTKKSGLEVQGIKNSLYFFSKFKGVVLKKNNEQTN